jgi:hypothetical protein
MARTITHLYDTYDQAAHAVRILEDAGIPATDISIVAADRNKAAPATLTGRAPVDDTLGMHEPTEIGAESEAAATAGVGASVGTVLGGGAGLLAGIGALAIPGVGPVVAAGWLIATFAGAGVGAAAGGLLGSLLGIGHSHDEAHVYAEGVRRGGAVVSVRAEDADLPRIDSLLATSDRVDTAARGDAWRAEGWQPVEQQTHLEPTGIGTATGVGTTGVGTTTSVGAATDEGLGTTVDDGRVVTDTPAGTPVLTSTEVELERIRTSSRV